MRDELLGERQGNDLVVLIDGADLDARIRADDRLACLKRAIEDAALR